MPGDEAYEREDPGQGWPGFAVVLFAGKTGEITAIRAEDLRREWGRLWVGGRVVLLSDREEAGVPEAAVPMASATELAPLWQAGPWRCYEVVSSLVTVVVE